MHVTALQSCLDDVVCYMGHRIRSVQQASGKAEYVSNMGGHGCRPWLQMALLLQDFMMKMLASNFWGACTLTSYMLKWSLQDQHWLLLVMRWCRET
jgi:hypothetical protein